MYTEFLVIPRLKVSGANLLAAWWCVAPPGPTAALGFAHALARAASTREIGVGLVHHDADYSIENLGAYTVFPQQRRGAVLIDKDDYAKQSKSLSLQPTVTGHLELSLIIEFPVNTVNPELVNDFLFKSHYGGGLILEHGAPKVLPTLEECQALIRTGFAVHDRSELLRDEQLNPLEKLLELTTPKASEKQSWLVPALLGYQAITPLAARCKVRGDYRHAYVEPLVGLTQYVPLRQAAVPIWSYHEANNAYFAKPIEKGSNK